MNSSLKTLLIGILLILVKNVCAQQDTLKYWIQFTDKNNSIYSINSPEQFLSSKSIARRQLAQLPISTEDLPVNSWYIDSLMQFYAVKHLNTSKWFNSVTISCFDTLSIQQIQQLSFVNQVHVVKKLIRDSAVELLSELPNEAQKSMIQLSNSPHIPYGYSYTQNHLHNIDYLHDMGYHGAGKVIAVIDAGFYALPSMPCFQELIASGRILSVKDFVSHDAEVYSDNAHGSSVLCTMAGKVENTYFGTATQASFHLLRSEDANTENWIEEHNWIAAAEYADSVGADIINTSLGYTTFDDSTQNHVYADFDGKTTLIAQAANKAASKGILVVVSAGNSGANAWKHISTPADADSALTVGAVDSLGNYAFFSSVGPASDGDIKPNVVSVGYHTYLYIPMNDTLKQANGTSFSAPMLAGMAACLWEAFPTLTAYELKKVIEESAHQYTHPDSLIGYGIPDFYAAYQRLQPVKNSSNTLQILTYYPNPIENQALSIVLQSSIEQSIKVEITSEIGALLYSNQLSIAHGKNLVQLTDFNESSGMYFLKISTQHEVFTPRILQWKNKF